MFLRFQGYPLLETEALACIAFFGATGVMIGFVFDLGGSWSRALMYALLITWTVDIQADDPDRSRLLWASFCGSLVGACLLRKLLPRWGTIMLTVVFLVSCVGPSQHVAVDVRRNASATPGKPELPIVLHVIFDQLTGVEGIPERFDADGSHARRLRDTFLERGFRVFGRAYSRYFNTHNALPHLFNFDNPPHLEKYVKRVESAWETTSNEYFELMSERGYKIHLYQTTHLDMFNNAGNTNIAVCHTVDPERLNAIVGSPLAFGSKCRIIMAMYFRRSTLASRITLPTQGRVSSIAALPILDRLAKEVSKAKPGTMFLVHLLFPHPPFALEGDCSVRPNPAHWLSDDTPQLRGQRNSSLNRADRYPLYLAQVGCLTRRLDEFFDTLQDEGVYDDMVILMHGDHGSRISLFSPTFRQNWTFITKQDYIDSFATMFAIKMAGVPPGYDRRMIPMDELFEAAIRNGSIPEGESWIATRTVYLGQRDRTTTRPMPEFGRTLGEP